MKYCSFRSVLIAICCLFSASTSFAQLVITPSQTAAALASKLAGPGISISSPVLTCASGANGMFVSTTTPLTVDSGIILSSGRATSAIGQESSLSSISNNTAGDAALTTLAGTATHDACVLEFDFIPSGDTVSFNYQFGSEEYNNSTCGRYNDVFAFFISGPGITGSQNMALVPGTNIPVTVNSINNGIPGSPGSPSFCNIANCTSMGPGSPFTSYYYDNTGGTQLTYKGFTNRLAAVHDVIPCNAYHLKIAIADASNYLYDSGVFIEAGSLKTNSFSFDRTQQAGATVNGVPNTIVRGCAPAHIAVLSGNIANTAQTVHFSFGGTAVRNTDFSAPDSATIAAGSNSVAINVAALIAATGSNETLTMYLSSPFSCGIVDSIHLQIIDTPMADIITPDTTVCRGNSFSIRTNGTAGLAYSWSPATTLNSSTMAWPVASPTADITYTMTATLAGTGCPATIKSVHITVTSIAVNILTTDTAVCLGASVNILVNGSNTFTYSWLPAGTLNNAGIKEPIATPTGSTTYTLTATSPQGCVATDALTISEPPTNAVIITPDTFICNGTSVTLRVAGDPTLSYSWTPGYGLDNPNAVQPVATPSVTTTYTMLAFIPGSQCSATGAVTLTVENIQAQANPDKAVCPGAEIILSAMPNGDNYTYLWNGPGNYTSTTQHPVLLNAQDDKTGTYSVRVTDKVTGCYADASAAINIVAAAALTNVTSSQSIPYGGSIQLNAGNAVYYAWSPEDGSLDNPNINNPVAMPKVATTYILHGLDINGCADSASVTISITYDTIFIPTAFSPNGDGLNDVFRVGNLGFNKLVEMSVFNRWGTMVYHVTDGNNKGWDGTLNGTPQDMAVFNYSVILSKPDGMQQSYKGSVTLIR